MNRSGIARVVVGLLLLAALVAWPVSELTNTRAERWAKRKLGVENAVSCIRTTASPGWTAAESLPEARDEPRAVTVAGKVYLVGGISAITDYGKPSIVRGVPEHVAVDSIRNLTEFDPATRRYTELPPLPEGLNHVGFAAYQGALYVVGGHGKLLWGADPRNELLRFDLDRRRWQRLASMPTPRGGVAVGVIGHSLYVAGGMRAGQALRTVEAYDFTTGRWRRVADLPAPREHIAGTVAGGRFYVLGGRNRTDDSLGDVTRYVPARDRWETLSSLPIPSGGLEAVTLDGAVVALGGGDDRRRRVFGNVQRLDPATGRWSQLARMRTPRHGFGAGVVRRDVWTFGGSACALFNPTSIAERFRPLRR